MPWSNSHHTSSKLHVYSLIFYYCCFYRTIYPLDSHLLTIYVLSVSLIIWMHDYVFVTELCFRSDGANFEWTILKVVKGRSLFSRFRLHFRKGSLMFRAPVDSSLPTINKFLIKHFYKSLLGLLNYIRV